MNLRLLVALSFLATVCNAYEVLVVGQISAKSHFFFISSFVRALVDRGHEVTYLTSNSLNNLKLPNYTEVLVDPPLDLFVDGTRQEKLIEKSGSSPLSTISIMALISPKFNKHAFESSNVQTFINNTELHFDVIVAEEFFADSFLMFAHKHKAPVVTICPFGTTDFIDRQQGFLTPLSFVSHWTLPYNDNMSFTERWYNVIVTAYDWIIRRTLHIPREQALVNKYFAHYAPLPALDDILRNVSIILVNSHRAIAPPRPLMPNVIPIGGAHIKSAKPLPDDLKTFIEEAKDGVIYFSLGSNLKCSLLPKKLIDAFIDTFKSLKQRVLWKFEDESRTDIPSNVMIRKWLPQNDILAHPNVKLFISHGGLFGTSESLYHGVPLLFIPFFGDQFRNAYRASTAGFGKFLAHSDVTQETFSKVLNDIISDESYLNKARETSAIFRDNLINPMDEAMFWIEHVAKFKGAKHLKSHAVNMSWFTYLLLDIVLVNIIIAVSILFVLYILIKKLFRKNKIEEVSNKKQQ